MVKFENLGHKPDLNVYKVPKTWEFRGPEAVKELETSVSNSVKFWLYNFLKNNNFLYH